MAGLCEGGNEPSGSLKVSARVKGVKYDFVKLGFNKTEERKAKGLHHPERRVVVLGYAVISSNAVKLKPYPALCTLIVRELHYYKKPFAVRDLDGSSQTICELCSGDNSRQKVEA
ncbi:hypothetical protein ANN_10139 [Periplaneta americana]|uniref:Uncharacterized protein n=1 Tax=Periplaneta americana TaxID=6978 RepID=A0ABQ8TQZ8_PERAM|nr:hypothetical protein ANN_10139 [Periplaneta americana]